MSNSKSFMNNVALGALLVGLMSFSTPVFAQSTGTEQTEVVVVTAARARSTGGLIEAEKTPKTRSNVTAEYIASQAIGQTVFQNLNLVPGLNFVNNDPYGSSGGNVRLRGFDGPRVSLTIDGVPLNDTGNYAIFTNQQLDGEYIQRTTVNTGTTDVDSPSASATGGTINLRMRRPDAEFGVRGTASIGSYNFRRGLVSIDSGEIGPWGTTAFAGISGQKYDKFKGPGDLEKIQFNARIYQPLRDNDFLSVSFHFNRNRNAFYRNANLATWDFYGRKFDNLDVCTRAGPVAGTAQNDGATLVPTSGAFLSANDNPLNPASCTNYFGLRINPSDTGNIRVGSSFELAKGLRLTVDPTYQYVLANGGGTTVTNENDRRLRGPGLVLSGTGAIASGVDLNGDGDVLDAVRLYTPNTTNTNRVGLNSSLIWDINDTNRLRLAYTFDYGRHRQTGEFTRLSASGDPLNVFGGRDGPKVFGVDQSFLRGRDRASIAQLNQIAIDYNGRFFDEKLRLNLGVRAPYFERELDQRCFSQNGSSNVLCTTETPNATLASGNVTFASTGIVQYIAPYKATRKYDAILPNIGISYQFTDSQSIYGSYAEGFSAPRTDNLYTVLRSTTNSSILSSSAVPETTQTFDLGYRFQTPILIASAAAWFTKYENRIVSAFDDNLGISVDRNVGSVDLQGFDVELGWRITENWNLNASASFNDSELKGNVPLSLTTALPTSGKKLVETPDTTYALRVQYAKDGFVFGAQGKYVSKRFSTDVNDEFVPEYTVVDLDVSYDLAKLGAKDTLLQFNIINVFAEDYFGNIASTNNALTVPNVSLVTGTTVARTGAAPTYSLGAPRTLQMSIKTKF
jgi:iron complex outermembrane recepter protein